MKEVFFIKAGTPYGYGYTAGEVGQVFDTDQTREVSGMTTKDNKPVIQTIARGFDWLETNGIVRMATPADKKKAADAAAAKEAAKPKRGRTTNAPDGDEPQD